MAQINPNGPQYPIQQQPSTVQQNNIDVQTDKQAIHIHNYGNLTINAVEGDQLMVNQQQSGGAVPHQPLQFGSEFGSEYRIADKTQPTRQEVFNVLNTLHTIEGSRSQAEEALNLLKHTRRPNEYLTDAANIYIAILETEGTGSTDQAIENYRIIDNSLRPGESRAQATQSFLEILHAEGTGSTDNAQDGYRAISRSLRPGENRETATQTYLALLRAEGTGSTNNAIDDYNTIARGLTMQHSRVEETRFFLDILAQKGSGNSSGAQREYNLYR